MTILGEIITANRGPETFVAVLAIGGAIAFGIWRGIKSLSQTRATPDPWDEALNTAMTEAEAVPLCHRCLCAHSNGADFCPECGAAVGQYTNWLPFPQLFSIGHELRIGTSGEFRRTPLVVAGFILFSLAEYTLFAPIYWIAFLRRIFRNPPDGPPPESPPSAPAIPPP